MSNMDYDPARLGRNWNGHPKEGKVMFEQHGEQTAPIEKYRSPYEQERDELGDNLVFLEAVIDTLHKRLRPVMSDVPSRATEEKLGRASSPVVAALNDANQRVNRCAMNLQEIIERLEV